MTQQTPTPPHHEAPTSIDRALFWFQLYGKQVALTAALLLFLTLLLLFFFARKSDTKIDQSIEADIIAAKLLDDQNGKISPLDRSLLVTTLIDCANTSSPILREYQGLIGQELLIKSESTQAAPYIEGAKKFLQQQDLSIYDQIATLTQTISHKNWNEAQVITNNLLTLPQFNPQEKELFLPVSYSYILLSRWILFFETKNNEELIRTQEQVKILLGLSDKQKCIPDELVGQILPLIQDGSVSLFDIGQERF